MEWKGRHRASLMFAIFCTIVLHEVAVEINHLEKTKVLLASPRFLHRRMDSLLLTVEIKKRRPIFENINYFVKQVSKSKRFERNSKLCKEMHNIIESLNHLRPGHLAENNAGQKVTMILNAIQEIHDTLALLSDLTRHLPDWSKQTHILLALNHQTYEKIAINLGQIKTKLPNLNWVILTEDQSKLSVYTLVNAVQRVSTPYLFLARGARKFDKDFKWNQFLKPLIRGQVDVVSGAVRYANGEWHSGCHQSKLIWSQYKTQHGYDLIHDHNGGNLFRSQDQKWIQCDYFDGPFAIKKDIFLAMLSPKIRKICPDQMLYRQLIYNLNNEKAIMTISQTNTFYLGTKKEELTRRQWLDFAYLNEISEVISTNEDHSTAHHEFNYTEVKSVCSNKQNMLKPRACIRDLHFMLMNSYRLFDK